MNSSERNFVKIVKVICEEENIKLETYSDDWIFKLLRNGVYNYIIGYQFGLNVASVNSICCDKSAASEIMTSLEIPNIEHFFFMSPSCQSNGNWQILIDKLNKYGKLVCKENEGSGGKQVFRVCNQWELESAVYKIFQKSRTMSVSPYYNINNEYRTVVLDGEIKLIYSKHRPCIIGDGVHSINSLIFEHLSKDSNKVNNVNLSQEDLMKVLDDGQCFELNWKHNLGQGSKAIILDDEEVKCKIKNLVNEVVRKMNVRFASIDIVECDGEYKVLEINSGVMMEHFSRQDENTYEIAKMIYKEAIQKMFD